MPGEAKPTDTAEAPRPVQIVKSGRPRPVSSLTPQEPLKTQPYDAAGFRRWWLSPVTFTVRVAVLHDLDRPGAGPGDRLASAGRDGLGEPGLWLQSSAPRAWCFIS